MEIKAHKTFIKNFKKRFENNPKFKSVYKDRFKLFQKDSTHPILRDHALSGTKLGLRSFSITGDVRIIYKEVDSIIYFLDIGTHSQVY